MGHPPQLLRATESRRILGRSFVGGQPCALVLGDNIFYGHDLQALLRRADSRTRGAMIFAYQVSDPERYGTDRASERIGRIHCVHEVNTLITIPVSLADAEIACSLETMRLLAAQPELSQ